MQISTNNFNTNFKSTFPVAHWIAESNSSFAPVSNLELVKKLQGKLVRVLNKPLKDSTKPFNNLEQKIRAYVGASDADYRNVPHVRSFYNRTSNFPQKFSPVSYIITGTDVDFFEEYLAKNIGRAKNFSKEQWKHPYSQGTFDAINLYNSKGLAFVKRNSSQIKDEQNMSYILHTKFEIIRNKLGKIKDYKLLDARFLPSSGPKNPLEKI